MRTLLVFLGLASVAFAAKFNSLQWKDCNPDPNRPFRINSMSISPGIVKIPGTLEGNFDVDITRAQQGEAEVELEIYKHRRFLKPAWIPCIMGWGSCKYNPCELIKPWETNGCPKELTNHNIPCTCPFPQAKAKMVKQMFKIPDLPWYLDWLAKGDYEVKAQLRAKATGQLLGCVEAKFSIEP